MIMVGRALQILLFFVFIHYWSMIVASGFYPNGSRDGVILCIEKEKQALFTFKQGLVDAYGKLSSWEKEDCCEWWGIRCDNKTGYVIRLDLQGNYEERLAGKISPSLLELQHLRYLDLSRNDFNGSLIPKFIGSLSNLRYLDLSDANFGGTIPSQLGNLSKLQSLDLSFANFSGIVPSQLGNLSNLQSLGLGNYYYLANVENLEWLSHLSSLKFLDLRGLNLSRATDWLQVVANLPHLINLILSNCELPVSIPKSLSLVNASTSLATLDLSFNNLTSSVFHWLFNFSSSLVDLDLGGNLLKGSLPNAFGNMSSLSYLDLSYNQLEGEIPKSLGALCTLQELLLQHNNLSGKLTGFMETLSRCKESSLQVLSLSDNQITGPFPNLTIFASNLTHLDLSFNQLNGTIPENLGQLSMLEKLDLSQNSLEGVISEDQFSNLVKLKVLDLSFNSLALSFKEDWVPPFQLYTIRLSSCKLGPHFPKWLLSQNRFYNLDISRAGISDSVPGSFWNFSSSLWYLNLSNNQINGTIPNSSPTVLRFENIPPEIDLSSNCFEGPIPPFLSNGSSLNFSKNKFSGPISFLCSGTREKVAVIDFSNNVLSSNLPDCWMNVKNLVSLNLASNNFSGKIPNSMGFLRLIKSLQLRNNNFIGGLPLSLKNCTKLIYMDLSENKLSETLPSWIGDSLSKLVVLILRSNQFQGNIPSHLCHLGRIQLLDLSFNNISGFIPKCLNNFTAIAQVNNTIPTKIAHQYKNFILGGDYRGYEGMFYIDSALFGWKRGTFEFKSTLGLVKLIDLSSNNLSGEIPTEITDLIGLISLNLSRNNLIGQIPSRIGQLTLLDVLDLSRNKLYGEIPPSLSQINRLSTLDLSNNTLSGKIPLGTQLQSFNASAYEGNLDLCGSPLPNKCDEEDAHDPKGSKSTGKHEDEYGFYVSVVLGFVVGFWSVCGTLVLNRSWRYAYFNFFNEVKDWVYVRALVYKAKLQKAPVDRMKGPASHRTWRRSSG